MIQYDSKNWFSFLFTTKGLYLKRIFWSLMVVVLLTAGIYMAEFVYKLIEVKIPLTLHSLMGVVLGLLLVFRTNTAYERWWEGRKLLGGLVNTSRNLALKLNAFLKPSDGDLRDRFSLLLSAFVLALPEHLRDGVKIQTLHFLDEPDRREIAAAAHKLNAVVKLVWRDIQKLHLSGRLTGEQLIIVSQNMNELIDEIGAMERIKNTPIPLPYSLLLKRFVTAYILTLPFALVHDLGWMAVVAVGVIYYVMVGIEIIGEEIENPFGTDENDLPVEEIVHNISRNVKEILNTAHGASVAEEVEGSTESELSGAASAADGNAFSPTGNA